MKNKIEELKIYKYIIIDIKTLYNVYQYNLRKQAELFLGKQTNDKYNLYFDENKKREKVKILSLYCK